MFVNPVMLPPGCDWPAMKPEGSLTIANTIGMVLVSRCSTAVTAVVEQKITSGCDPISSVAKALARLASPFVHRCSNRMLRPSVQPNRASSSTKAAKKENRSRTTPSVHRCGGPSRLAAQTRGYAAALISTHDSRACGFRSPCGSHTSLPSFIPPGAQPPMETHQIGAADTHLRGRCLTEAHITADRRVAPGSSGYSGRLSDPRRKALVAFLTD